MRTVLVGLVVVGLAMGCEDKPKPTSVPSSSAAPLAASSAPLAAPAASLPRSSEKDELAAPAQPADAGSLLGALSDVGPAGPASASRFGVVMVTRDDEVVLAKPATSTTKTLEPVAPDAGAFVAFARGPSVAGPFAYWISKGRLVRRRVDKPAPLESLATIARDGTRVSAAPEAEGRPASAAFIARPEKPDGDPTAMLWVEGQDPVRVSPEGAAASSVALALVGSDTYVAYIEGRSGMSPVHLRRARYSHGAPKLDEDVVIWVGGTAQPLTELVTGTTSAGELWTFVPMERDSTRFGLAQLRVGGEPKMGVPVTWRSYPNGLDPAPLSLVEACGSTMVAYVRPSEAKPHAPQELHVARLEAEGLGPPQVVARSRAFANVSLANTGGALLLVYVADHRTWAVTVSCPSQK